ncbi:hypothetical protein [Kiloniella antarctica]|uniref:DUF3592 domain-containing protein n=1 Tax=Kiloniella antarctica TaxID=1550907 RepID=A0ABW5BJV5_9PROT
MKILFNLVLLFCSKDFILFYRDIKGRGVLNEAALLAYFVMFFFKAVFWIVLFCLFILNFWKPESSVLMLNALFLGSFLLTLLIIFVIIRSQVRDIEVLARAYSDGDVAAGIITEKSFWKGKHTYNFKYTVKGRNYQFEKKLGLLGGVDSLGDVGDTFPLIYAQSDPNIVELYHKVNFSKRCLVKDKLPPDDLSKDEEKKFLAR